MNPRKSSREYLLHMYLTGPRLIPEDNGMMTADFDIPEWFRRNGWPNYPHDYSAQQKRNK